MAPSPEELRELAEKAEMDVNTYQAKTGMARGRDIDEAGVDTRVEKRFEGASVKYTPELVTNRGWNRRIPPDEGGEILEDGRVTRGSDFEGPGGPEEKAILKARERGGDDDDDVVPEEVLYVEDTGKARGGYTDVMDQGEDATRSNVGRDPPGVGGSHWKGAEYELPESVPDQSSEQGTIPGEKVRQYKKGEQVRKPNWKQQGP